MVQNTLEAHNKLADLIEQGFNLPFTTEDETLYLISNGESVNCCALGAAFIGFKGYKSVAEFDTEFPDTSNISFNIHADLSNFASSKVLDEVSKSHFRNTGVKTICKKLRNGEFLVAQ